MQMQVNDWFLTDQGLEIAEDFCRELSNFPQLFVGEKLLQLGSAGANSWLNCLNYKHKIIIDTHKQSHSSCQAVLHNLPIAHHSVDCIVLPLALEQTAPHWHLLDEIDRVLKPMGYVIFLTVNPFSLFGLDLLQKHHKYLPQELGNLYFAFSLRYILLSRDYKALLYKAFYRKLPQLHDNVLKKPRIFARMPGQILPAGFSCFIAQKIEVCGPTLNLDYALAFSG
jgi:Methyltransferase domain